MDLRQRIVDAHLRQEGSARDLAIRFGVAPSTVCGLLKHLAQRGSLAPLPNRGRITFWQPEPLEVLRRVVADKNDATLQQIADALARLLPRSFHLSAVSRGLRRLQITRKKKTSTPPSATRQRSNTSE